jgi:hypothetical protein
MYVVLNIQIMGLEGRDLEMRRIQGLSGRESVLS